LLGRYTKALDQIKQLRKEQTVEIKVDKEKLSALKTDRDRATKVRPPLSSRSSKSPYEDPSEQLKKAIDELASSIDVKSAEHEQLEEQIAELVRANKTFFNQATKYQDIIGKAETLRERRKLVEDNLVQVRANLTELQGASSRLATGRNGQGSSRALVLRFGYRARE
jgi:DNA repair protein RAD50